MNRKLGNNYFVCIELGYGKCIESLKKLYGKAIIIKKYNLKSI